MKYKNIIILIFSVIVIFSCKKETTSFVGDNILPESDKFGTKYFEFDNIQGVTVMGERLQTNGKSSAAMLGSINFNDEYGQSKADFMVQTRLSVVSPSFGENPVVDSVKFTMLFSGDAFYGDTTSDLNFKVYELTESIYIDSAYYSNHDASMMHDEFAPICNQTLSPNPESGFLELTLDKSFGEKIIADTSNLVDNETYLEAFKGLYVTTDSVMSGGVMLYLNLSSPNSQVTIYYHNDVDTADFGLIINNLSAEFGMFKNTGHNNINFNDSSDFIYTQPMAGIRGKIDLSPVKMFADSENYTINKAEIIFDYYDGTYTEPGKMFLQVADGKSDTINVPRDYSMGYYNGNYDEDDNTYSFVITKHVTDIISGTQEFSDLYIYPNDFKITANRATLINNFDNKNIKLKIIYTKY